MGGLSGILTHMSEPVLEVHNLSKSFGPFQAVDTVSFSVPRGKVVGLLGPNGAGKTTTIHMLLGITLSTSGTVKYFGKDFAQHRQEIMQRINFASSYNTLLGRISAEQNLLMFAHLYRVKNPKQKIAELAEHFGAEDLLDKTYWDLSAGQHTRVNLMKALLNEPELVLLDEPTASLDPDIADRVLTFIEELREERGISMLYTSHNMDEVTRICDEVIFLDHGKIVAHDTPANLTKKVNLTELKLVFEGASEKVESVLQASGLKYQLRGSTASIHTDDTHLAGIIASLVQADILIIDVEVNKPDLEDVFLQIARGGSHVL